MSEMKMSSLWNKNYQDGREYEKSANNIHARLQDDNHVRLKEKSKTEFFNVSKLLQKQLRTKLKRYKSDVDLARIQRTRSLLFPGVNAPNHSNNEATFKQISKAQQSTGVSGLPFELRKYLRSVVRENHVKPLVKFKRVVKVIQLLVRATRASTQGKGSEALLSWAHNDNVSKREYETHGLTFDPSYYRAKREIPLSNEAKVILSLDPEERTEGQLKIALIALNQAVEAFSEFPIKMQKSLVRVGWYEQFEDRRVIIRQGHKADNFYVILSGTAVVTILQTDKESGEEVIRTVAVLKKGNSFGELALMYGSTRSATVTCKNSVELLAVGRQDFVDIFMPASKDSEPEHIQFLRTIQLLDGWPIEKLPYQNPKICCFMYFRRGLVLCKDSNSSDWVYIVKSGTCRILKALHVTKPQVLKAGYHNDIKRSSIRLPPIVPIHKLSHTSNQSSSSSSSSKESSPRHFLALSELSPRHRKCNPSALSDLLYKTNHYDEPMALEHQNVVDRILAIKHSHPNHNGKYTFKRYSSLPPTDEVTEKKHKMEEIFVQIQNLGSRDTYGIEQVAFGQIGPTTSTVLVSEGAECILINRKFFRQYLSDEMAKRIRRTIRPIPTDESLQQKLQDKTNWEAYKSRTVVTKVINGQSKDSGQRYNFFI